MTCDGCGKTRDTGKRLPRNWKRHGTKIYCDACVKERFCLRAISFPVASVDDWTVFQAALKAGWSDVTACSNWISTELYARDVRREANGPAKMPAMKVLSLYSEIRKKFPGLASNTVVSLERAMQAKYRAKRYEVIWTGAASLPNHRYPTPLPIKGSTWRGYFGSDERPYVAFRLGDKRWEIRLRGGPRFRRQLAAFRQIVAEEAIQGEMALYRIRDHAKGGYQIMVKMVARFPRRAIHERSGQITVVTSKESLMVAVNEKEEKVWVYHGDHLRRWAAEHRKQLNRWGDDQKYEERPRAPFQARREAAAAKHRKRMDSATHQISAALVNYADRRRIARIVYDDQEIDFCSEFPWFELKRKIEYKLDAVGVEFITSAEKSHAA